MNPPLLRTMGLAAVALLLGSFPVRQVWGPVPCDIMRLGGSPSFYAVGLCFFVLGLNAGREDK